MTASSSHPLDNLHRVLLDTAAEPCVILERDGTVLAANQAMAQRLSIPCQRLAGQDVFALFPPEMARRRRQAFLEVLENNEPLEVEDVTSSGAQFTALLQPVCEDDAVALVVVWIRDYTKPKKLEEQRIRLATALEQALEAVLLLDTDFNIQYVNQSFEAMTGYAQKEILGRNLEFLYQEERQRRHLARIIASLEENDAWAGRTRHTRKDGTPIDCEQTISRIRYGRSRELGYVSVWRDVTEVAALERQLRQAQKMEAIGTLAGGLAHDFNNILGPIILYTEMGLQGLEEDSPLFLSLNEILDAANRARELVEQILGLSRQKEHDKPVPFMLSSIAKECLKLLKPSMPPNVRVSFVNDASNDMLLADPTQVHQLIMNLCTNAAHALSTQGGELEIRLSDERVASGTSEYQPLQPGPYVRMEVRDSGVGIPREQLDRIFDPFYTTKKEGKGTGLGLAVVLNIVTHLGGAVDVQSTPGKGSTFTVLLPKCTVEALDYAGLECRGRSAEQVGRLRILLVDDDRHTGCGSRQVLEELGHQVSLARSPYEALALFRDSPESFDLVIAEFDLQELDGMTLTREMLFNRPELPVALCTNHSELALEERALACGARGILQKPFHAQELRSRLAAICFGQTDQG